MRFLVVGVGAIGGAYLAFLAKAGHEAVGLVKPGKRLERIGVTGIWGDFTVSVRTFEDPQKVPFQPDLVILSVKSFDTEKALRLIEPLVGDRTLIMIAQNGYGNYEKAVDLYGEGKVILSRIIFGSKVLGPGRIKITVCADDVVIGDPSGKIEEGFLRKLADIFSEAGIPTRYEPEVYKYLWDKIIYNSALNPLGALLEVNYGTLAENPHTRRIMDAIIDEIFSVLKAGKIETFWEGPKEFKETFYGKLIPPTAGHYPSMLEDIKRGRTEIDSLNGAIVKLGRKFGVPTPVNEAVTLLVKAKELLFDLNR